MIASGPDGSHGLPKGEVGRVVYSSGCGADIQWRPRCYL